MKQTNKMTEIKKHLDYIKLSGIKECFEESIAAAEREGMSYTDFLLHILQNESDHKRNKKIERLQKESKLSAEKTFATFDMNRIPLKVRQKVKSIIDGGFIDRKENILVFGQPGTGKTHLISAIAFKQIESGRKVLFTSCALIVQKLLIAKKNLELEKYMRMLSKFEAVIIDDIGYVQQDREEMEVLFTFLAERYERGSLMISSNLPFSKWDKIFKDPMTTAAAIDRIVHHSIILELNILSYRAEHAKKILKEADNGT
jgi:DNA replication protein DnaC